MDCWHTRNEIALRAAWWKKKKRKGWSLSLTREEFASGLRLDCLVIHIASWRWLARVRVESMDGFVRLHPCPLQHLHELSILIIRQVNKS